MQALRTGWDFFQNEVLGMKWLNRLIGSILEACGLDLTSKVGGSIQFFIYDVIKIMVLLGVLILLISYIQSYFPPERTKRILGRFHGIGANCVAALLGTVTPFCSCSSIPLFIGFTSAGLPLGVTFSFLISSPMVDLGSLVLLMSIFGLTALRSMIIDGRDNVVTPIIKASTVPSCAPLPSRASAMGIVPKISAYMGMPMMVAKITPKGLLLPRTVTTQLSGIQL